ELDDVLQRMGNITDFNDLNTLRYDADRIAGELKDEQQELEVARSDLQSSEKRLRSNARLFVWIDHPDSKILDQIMLFLFTIAFLSASLIALKMKDRLLKLL